MSKPEGRFHVVTGGPGSGKSTLIEALHRQGHDSVEEAGRAVIREQLACGGDALPWRDPLAYSRRMLARDVAAWSAALRTQGPIFFDRGIPDIKAYLRLIGAEPLPEVEAAVAAHRYARTVFVAPPWHEIYAQDEERKQDFAEACWTFDAMCETYDALGHRLVELPRAPVADRVAFLLEAVARSHALPPALHGADRRGD